jgi:hypothetical protein
MHHPNDDISVTVAALKDRIFSKDCGPSLSDYDAWQQWQRKGAAKPERKRRERKHTLASVAKQASKAGIEVARYEVEPDGKIIVVTGKPGMDNAAVNEWDEDLYGKDKTPTRQ